jgi:hypothetical protein
MMSVARRRFREECAMGYLYTFTFRLSAHERQLLAALAQRLYRTESGTLRWLIYEAAREREIMQHPAAVEQAGDHDVRQARYSELTERSAAHAARTKEL